jgi:monoterpene epsilon-lactone hydrolase
MASYRVRAFETLLKVAIRSAWRPDVASVPRIRERLAFIDALFPKHPRGASVSRIDADGVPCDWVTANGADSGRVLLYIHGGGFSVNLPRLYAGFAADLSARLQARVLLVDYRLAPEHPFPAAPDDCLTAYRWLLQQAGVEPGEMMIAGDSAGGNLILVTLLMAKQAGLPMPAAGWAISPGVDCDWSHGSLEELQAVDPMFSTQALDLMTPYFGDTDRTDFRVSPINGDLAGLPPLLIEAGGKEMFREHPAMFAGRARAAGVKVEDRVWFGMPHVFQAFGFLPEAQKARRRACRFLLDHTGKAPFPTA